MDNAICYEEVKNLKNRLNEEKLYLQEEIKTEYNFEEIVGRSRELRKVLQSVEQVAPTGSSVLISGETGTGKELIARAIHQLSKRKERALIKVNCAALPAGLIESELFGHEKGAFTGATHKRVGRFELADGGTLFLDEVGDLPQDLQVKLLRVLQEQEFERVGGTQTIKVDVRVIAATNRALSKGVKEGRFRSDLYYRLNVFPILLPALRERAEDIPLLAKYFVNKYMRRIGKRFEGIDQATVDWLVAYSWPGNIRELENIIERAVILSKEPILRVEEDLSVFSPEEREEGRKGLTLEEVERRHILEILMRTRGVIGGSRGAAKILNMHPNTLRSRMDKLGIKRDR
jgi:formate hydrogenlyase transcriptional activator